LTPPDVIGSNVTDDQSRVLASLVRLAAWS
jgi:hypothetical protein